MESLSVLIAIRKAPENQANQGTLQQSPIPRVHRNANKSTDKRNKRHRGSSPLSAPGTPAPTPVNKVTLNVKMDRDRASEGPAVPPPQPFKSDAKARAKFYSKQLPLQEGRKVAFHPPSTGSAEPTDENTWILAVVIKCISQEKNR